MLTPVVSVFVDTNVLLYSFDMREAAKRRESQAWLDCPWRNGNGRLSWQVLHEFYTNAIRMSGMPAPDAREMDGSGTTILLGQSHPRVR